MATLTIVYGEDWTGLYLDDRLLDQGHSLETGYVLEQLVAERVDMGDASVTFLNGDMTIHSCGLMMTIDSYLEDNGGLPQSLKDLGL